MSIPKRSDEAALWDAFGPGTDHRWPREAARSLGIPHRRALYLCEKWTRQRVYDYGVSADLGWKAAAKPWERARHRPPQDGPTVTVGGDAQCPDT